MKILKKTSSIILISFILILSCGFYRDFNPQIYDVGRIMSNIRQLSSEDFNGRMAGSEYGRKTEELVAAEFKKIGLEPCSDNGTYFQEFQGINGNPKGPYVLEVLDGENVVKTYKYAEGYKFFGYFSHKREAVG